MKIILLAVSLLLASCSDSDSRATTELDKYQQNKTKWQSQNLSNYEYLYNQTTDTGGAFDDLRVSIVNNALDLAYISASGEVVPDSEFTSILFRWTMDEIFDELERYVPRENNSAITIRYNQEFGYPSYIEKGGDPNGGDFFTVTIELL